MEPEEHFCFEEIKMCQSARQKKFAPSLNGSIPIRLSWMVGVGPGVSHGV